MARSVHSESAAMRALAAIFILSMCLHLHAHQPRGLQTVKNILNCGITLGPSKCLNAITAWHAERAIENPNVKFNLRDDLEHFPWINYRNNTDEELYSEACDGTEKLLRRKSLSLTVIPGYRFELMSKGNGSLKFAVFKNADSESSRSSMKKAKKKFNEILPFLVLPGLLMSAVLPFILPVLSIMVFGVGMLNNMALSGAVFTLLRNNAFDDTYHHKIIYANEGYKNEKHTHFEEYGHAESNHFDVSHREEKLGGYEMNEKDIEELPLSSDWIKEQYGQNVQFADNGHYFEKRDNKPNTEDFNRNT